MSNFFTKHFKWIVPAIMLVLSQAAAAQATRTWVSGVGDDANPCSRTAPCKTFAGAISKTAAGGEINAIDSGGFGAVNITKAIVIDGAGVQASILSSGTNGITVNAGVNDVVVIRNVSINGAGATLGLNGIRYLAGKALHVENVVLQNFSQKGIDVTSTTPNSALYVRDTEIRNAADPVNGGGIRLKPTSPGTVKASLENVRLDRNLFGLRVEDNAKATVNRSVASNSINAGFTAVSTSAAAEVFVESSVADGNGFGIVATGASSKVLISNVSIFNNNQGLLQQSSGIITSFSNNKNSGNVGGNNGAPSGTVVQQ